MSKIFRVALALILLVLLVSFTPQKEVEASDLLTHPDFTFVIASDLAIDDSDVVDVISNAATDVNAITGDYAPSFVAFLGDIISEPSKVNLSYANAEMASFDADVHVALGPDDSGTDKTYWELLFGPRNYAFDEGDYHFIVLDSTKPASVLTYGGGFDDATVDWLTDHLAGVDTETPVIVLSHHCPWSPMMYEPRINLFDDTENGHDVMDMFDSYNVVAWCAGHSRQSMQYTHHTNDINFIVTASMDANDTDNVDDSPAGYTLVEVYSDSVKAYWIPLGEVQSYYIKPKTYEVSVGSGYDYDGTTSEFIQSAISACNSNGGGTVVLKANTTFSLLETGTYSVPVQFYSNVWLIGLDPDTTILQVEAGTDNVKALSNGYTGYVDNIRIENLTIDGNKDNCPDGEESSHVWNQGIQFDGNDSEATYDNLADNEFCHDIVVENVTIHDFWHRGICSYVEKRYAIRNCTFDDMNGSISPDHPCEFWQIEGNTITNDANVAIEGNDLDNALIYNNSISSSERALEVWAYLSHVEAIPWESNIKFVYNTVSSTSSVDDNCVEIQSIKHSQASNPTGIEIMDNSFTNITANTGIVINMNNTAATGCDGEITLGNTFNAGTVMHEFYAGADSIEFWSPDYSEFTGSPTATAATVHAEGGYYCGSSPYPDPPTDPANYYQFQKAEYTGSTINYTTSSSQASDTYEWTSLDEDYMYAFRSRSYQSATLWSGWTPWIWLHEELSNRAPVLDTIGDRTVTDGETLTFTVTASDDDDDELTFSASNLPSGANFNTGTQVFSWTPSTQEDNYDDVHFEVTDGTIAVAEDINITVVDTKMIFVWGVNYKLLDAGGADPDEEQDRFVVVCGEEGVNVAVLQLDSDSLEFFANGDGYREDAYQNLVTTLNAAGIELYMCLGGVVADLTSIPDSHYDYLDAIIGYNQDNEGLEIAGIVWNIEGDFTDLWDDAVDYMETMEAYEYNSETIVDQGLNIGFATAYEGGAESDYLDLIALLDLVYLEAYEDQLDSGAGGGIVGVLSTAMALCEANDVPFVYGLETDILDTAHAYKSVSEEGLDGYHELEQQANYYFTDNYDYVQGHYLHHYQRSGETWHEITASEFTYLNQVVTATFTLKNSGYYQTSLRGLAVQIKDEYGNIYEENCVRILTSLQERELELTCTAPAGVDVSASEARVIYYDIDQRNDTRDPVYALWDTYYSGAGLPSDPEDDDMTLDDYCDAVKADPDTIFDGYGRQRSEIAILDYTDWTALGEEEEEPTVTLSKIMGIDWITD